MHEILVESKTEVVPEKHLHFPPTAEIKGRANIIIVAGDFHGNKELLMTTDKHRNFLAAKIRCPKSGRDSGRTPEIPAEPLYSPLFRSLGWRPLSIVFPMFKLLFAKCFSKSF